MKYLRLFASVVLIISITSPCFGEFDLCKESLRGIKSISVFIASSMSDGGNGFLSKIKTDVELKLRMAGVKVLDTASLPEDKRMLLRDNGFLQIDVYITERENVNKAIEESWIMYVIQIDLLQLVNLDRNHVQCLSPTWSNLSYNGACLKSLRDDEIRKHVTDLADTFLNDYLAENPKQAVKP